MIPDDDIALFARGYYGRFGVDARWRAADQAARLGTAGAEPRGSKPRGGQRVGA